MVMVMLVKNAAPALKYVALCAALARLAVDAAALARPAAGPAASGRAPEAELRANVC